MKKAVKTLLCAGMISSMVMGSAMSALAGTWRTGTGENAARWWYDFDNGSYAAGGWATIDGNNDGIAETYFFDAEGWMLADTVTPDGQTVNADGVWVVNGQVVQTNLLANAAEETQAAQDAQGYFWMLKMGEDGNYTKNDEVFAADGQDYLDWMSKFFQQHSYDFTFSPTMEERINFWAQNSSRGAAWKQLFDRYGLDVARMAEFAQNREMTITFTTPAGISREEEVSALATSVMLGDLCTDGMAKYYANSNWNADGTVTIVITVELWWG